MDLHICNKKEVFDIELNSIVCSWVSHKPLMYPIAIEDNCCKIVDDVSIPLVRGNKSKELPKL